MFGLQGASLGTMAGFLTYGNKKFHHLDSKMRTLIPPLYDTMKELLPYVDHDAAAFNDYMVGILNTIISSVMFVCTSQYETPGSSDNPLDSDKVLTTNPGELTFFSGMFSEVILALSMVELCP